MLLAAVDLGSNSFRMEIGEVVGERIVSRQYHKEYVRLAGGFDADGRITPLIRIRSPLSYRYCRNSPTCPLNK